VTLNPLHLPITAPSPLLDLLGDFVGLGDAGHEDAVDEQRTDGRGGSDDPEVPTLVAAHHDQARHHRPEERGFDEHLPADVHQLVVPESGQ